MLGNYRVAAQLVAFRVVLSSIELVSSLVKYVWRGTQSICVTRFVFSTYRLFLAHLASENISFFQMQFPSAVFLAYEEYFQY
jgi:hypothetical protein